MLKQIVDGILKLDSLYGYLKIDKPRRIIVEHTSVNPIHSIHIGQARNPVLGDALVRILKARGHKVSAHYYIDDMGRQTAIIAYGYEMLGRSISDIKPDHFIGQIYSVTSCLIEIDKLKKQIKSQFETNQKEILIRELNEWKTVSEELTKKYPETFSKLKNAISQDKDPEESVNSIIRNYEKGEKGTKELVRQVAEKCLKGFKQTLSKLDIHFDCWDWESDLLWSGRVADVMKDLQATQFVTEIQGIFGSTGLVIFIRGGNCV